MLHNQIIIFLYDFYISISIVRKLLTLNNYYLPE